MKDFGNRNFGNFQPYNTQSGNNAEVSYFHIDIIRGYFFTCECGMLNKFMEIFMGWSGDFWKTIPFQNSFTMWCMIWYADSLCTYYIGMFTVAAIQLLMYLKYLVLHVNQWISVKKINRLNPWLIDALVLFKNVHKYSRIARRCVTMTSNAEEWSSGQECVISSTREMLRNPQVPPSHSSTALMVRIWAVLSFSVFFSKFLD